MSGLCIHGLPLVLVIFFYCPYLVIDVKKMDSVEMDALQEEVELLSQALMFLVDNLIDRDLTTAVEPGYMKHAFQILKDRGLVDYTRNELFEKTFK